MLTDEQMNSFYVSQIVSNSWAMECTCEFSLNIFSLLKYKMYTLNKKYVLSNPQFRSQQI